MRRIELVVFCFLFLWSSALLATPPGDQATWELTFSDEFNGTSLDTTKWATVRSDGGRDMSDAQSWFIDANVQVSGGLLRLKATNVQSRAGFPYSGSCISGHNAFNQMYGYFESSMKLPKGAGLWPAFWLMPKSSNNSWLWPPEIDVMENLGANTNLIYMTNHYSSNYPNAGVGHGQTGGSYSGPDYSSAFHTIAVLWDSTQIVWYIDDVQRFRVTDYVPIAGHGWPGMYILFDLAVGGSWGGPPNAGPRGRLNI
jgi:beta-glucanase (GH16 family)